MEINLTQLPPEVQQAKQRFGIVGNSPALVAAVTRAVNVAPIDLSVLVNGESGTGKEFFPQIIHAFSPRKHSRYIAVNCGAIPEGTIDSELFGHEKGAFTGAVAARKGYFEEADGGTVFLDEVAELPLTTQARLLRVLESGEFMKVGSSTVQRTNIRIVAATNVDMARAVAEGRFREDLYYRLSTVVITLPPLRERGRDVQLLARKFASDFAERYGTAPVELAESARAVLSRYRWPGNVRQLKNVMDQVALFEAGTEVDADVLRHYLPAGAQSYSPVLTRPEAHEYEKERELLFNMIFRLQADIEQLRSQLNSRTSAAVETPVVTDISGDVPQRSLVPYDSRYAVAGAFLHDAAVEEVPVAIGADGAPAQKHTLEDTERETIRRSLERNNGRRKATARELNISERTLYRKIKDYGLDE